MLSDEELKQVAEQLTASNKVLGYADNWGAVPYKEPTLREHLTSRSAHAQKTASTAVMLLTYLPSTILDQPASALWSVVQ